MHTACSYRYTRHGAYSQRFSFSDCFLRVSYRSDPSLPIPKCRHFIGIVASIFIRSYKRNAGNASLFATGSCPGPRRHSAGSMKTIYRQWLGPRNRSRDPRVPLLTTADGKWTNKGTRYRAGDYTRNELVRTKIIDSTFYDVQVLRTFFPTLSFYSS